MLWVLLSHKSVAVAIPLASDPVSAEQSIVAFGGQLITGGVISVTVMIWLQLAELWQASEAIHVRVII